MFFWHHPLFPPLSKKCVSLPYDIKLISECRWSHGYSVRLPQRSLPADKPANVSAPESAGKEIQNMSSCSHSQPLTLRVDQSTGKRAEALASELFIPTDPGIEVGPADVNGSEIIALFIRICSTSHAQPLKCVAFELEVYHESNLLSLAHESLIVP